MNKLKIALLITFLCCQSLYAACPDFLDADIKLLHSDKTLNICESYPNQPVLIVNTASKCGFTHQFKGLEVLHKQYKDRGLLVVGFPSNTFNQEINNEEKVAEVCYINYGVTFPMFSTVSVLGEDAHPIFRELAKRSEAPGWNFNKYLVNKNGQVIEHFGSRAKPDSEEFKKIIESVL